MDVLHAYVKGFYAEAWVVYACPLGQQFGEQQRVLAARKSNEHVVIVLQQVVGDESLDETLVNMLE
jgi:hypothetical protein